MTCTSPTPIDLTCLESVDSFDIPPPSHKPTFPPLNRWQHILNEAKTSVLDESLIVKLEMLSGKPVLPMIRRGLVQHSEFDRILNEWTQSQEPFYILISRGIRTSHLGHMPALILAQYIQSIFHCPVILQMVDDKSFMYTVDDVSLSEVYHEAWKTALEAISAVPEPFEESNTFVYSTLSAGGKMYYATSCRILRALSGVEARIYTGVQQTENIGRMSSLGMAIAPLFSESFPVVLGARYQSCLRIGGSELASHLCVARRIPDDRSSPHYLTPRIYAGLFTQYVPAITNPQNPMHETSGGIFLCDNYEIVLAKLSADHITRSILLQLLWWFGEGLESTLDWISWELDDDRVRRFALDAVWNAVNGWKERSKTVDIGEMFQERPLRSTVRD